MKHVTYDPTGWDEAALERAAEALWFNQTEGRSGALGVSWASLPETRRSWWRYQALAGLRAYVDAAAEPDLDAVDVLARVERLLDDERLGLHLTAASPAELGYQVEVERSLDEFDEYVNVAVAHADSLRAALCLALTLARRPGEVTT